MQDGQGGLAFVAIGISVVSLAFNVWLFRDRKRQDRRDLFLKMHDRLVEVEVQRGRAIVHAKITSADAAELLRDTDPASYDLANRAMAMFDILGLYVHRGYLDSELVLQEWGEPIRRIWPKAALFLLHRDGGRPGSAWPHFRRLARAAGAIPRVESD